jgi:pyruvate dehydrogenase E2 component (dihydrolipoamide acetyltransferase)
VSSNLYVPESDVYGRRPDGRSYLIARAGVPMLDTEAQRLGLIKPSPPVRPSETKAPQPEDGEEPAIVKATPGAMALAKKLDVDLEGVEGSGANGRITKSDVEAAVS